MLDAIILSHMSNLKDSLNTAPVSKTVTLSADDVLYLTHINQYAQVELTKMQEYFAGQFLAYLSIHKFEMDPTKNYTFNFHPEKESDNLTITEIPQA